MKSFGVFLAMLFLSSGSLWAQGENPIDTGNTAWMITATVLVLMMTLPGLALFYGGLVRSKNVLSVLMHCYAIAALASIMWVAFLYSMSFDNQGGKWVGGLSKSFLEGVGLDSVTGGIPETVFVMFQMTFAIITPGLIVGAFVERMKFVAVMVFTALWLVLVYAPAVFWVWGGGIMASWGVIDLAGGIVVHATAGVSALVLAKMIGPRRGFPKQLQPPHSSGLVMIGASLLWVGWFGFNAGSALAANGDAGMAMLVTHVSAAAGALTWMACEWTRFGRPSALGAVTGMVAGLGTITPASGYVGPGGALVIGILAGFVCYHATVFLKQRLKVDDSLDVFPVHGVGGALGTLLAAVFASAGLGVFSGQGLAEGMTIASQFQVQLIGVLASGVYTAIVTFVLLKLIDRMLGLRVSQDEETEGLDLTQHNERGYDL